MEEYEGLHSKKESWEIFFINLIICTVLVLIGSFLLGMLWD
ncbi:hypothetical protein [Bacillus mycoides]